MNDPNDQNPNQPPQPTGDSPAPNALDRLDEGTRAAVAAEIKRAHDSAWADARRTFTSKPSKGERAQPAESDPLAVARRAISFQAAGYGADEALEYAAGNFALPPLLAPPPRGAAPQPTNRTPVTSNGAPSSPTAITDDTPIMRLSPSDQAALQKRIVLNGSAPARCFPEIPSSCDR